MKHSIFGVAMGVAVVLAGCGEKANAKPPAVEATAPASQQGNRVATAPAPKGKAATPRVGGRMQIEPVGKEKFNLGPKRADKPTADRAN